MARRAGAKAWPDANDGEVVARRRESVSGIEIDSESVLYDERSGRLHLLNWSASVVWWSIDGVSSTAELADDLAARFDMSHEAMRDDVVRLLRMFWSQQLIEVVHSCRPSRTNA
jgi:hypothetical protein